MLFVILFSAKLSSTKRPHLMLLLMLLLFQGTNLWQSWLMCIFIVFIYVSRALYNIMALVFQHYLPDLGYGLINVTDQVSTSYSELILL